VETKEKIVQLFEKEKKHTEQTISKVSDKDLVGYVFSIGREAMFLWVRTNPQLHNGGFEAETTYESGPGSDHKNLRPGPEKK
jgi:hypothetical protein